MGFTALNIKLSTEVKVNPKNWDNNAKCIKKSAPYARVDNERLRPEDIHDGIITQKQMKTNEVVSIPCHPKVAEIIEKYHGAPDIPAQSLNSCIKEICREAGICERIGIRRHGAAETTYYEKWELVSSHTARRSAATNMYKAGIPTIAIMKITGHKSERVFMDYIKVSGEENARMLKKNPFFN